MKYQNRYSGKLNPAKVTLKTESTRNIKVTLILHNKNDFLLEIGEDWF